MRSIILLLFLAGCNLNNKIDCANSPVITYANFGQSFMGKECQGCHGQFVTGENRQDAPAEFFYDTPERVWEDADLILVTTTGNDPIMPPSDGVFAEDRLRLEIWLRCGQNGKIDGVQLDSAQETP